MTPSRDISRLIEIMAELRTPVTGCPWDLEQNFATIAPYTIEEAYEVADAIADGNLSHTAEELGDVIGLGAQKVAPRVAVVLNSAGEHFAAAAAGEQIVIAEGNQSLEHQGAVGRLFGRRRVNDNDGIGLLRGQTIGKQSYEEKKAKSEPGRDAACAAPQDNRTATGLTEAQRTYLEGKKRLEKEAFAEGSGGLKISACLRLVKEAAGNQNRVADGALRQTNGESARKSE